MELNVVSDFEKEWLALKTYVYRGVHCNSLLPLQYLKLMSDLALPISGPDIKFYAMVAFVGALFESNVNVINDIFIKLSIFRIISYYYPNLKTSEKHTMLVNLRSLVALMKSA